MAIQLIFGLIKIIFLSGSALASFKVQYNIPCVMQKVDAIESDSKEFLIFCDPAGATSLTKNTVQIRLAPNFDGPFTILAQRNLLPASVTPLAFKTAQFVNHYLFHFPNGTSSTYYTGLAKRNDILVGARTSASSHLVKHNIIFFATYDPANINPPKFHQYDTDSTQIKNLVIDHKVDSICHRKLFLLNEIYTTSIQKKRMVIDYSKTGPLTILNQLDGLYAEQDSIQPETSLGNYFIAASFERSYIVQISTTDLSDISVVSSWNPKVRCSSVVEIYYTEYFIVHGVGSDSFLVAEHQPTRVVFLFKEVLLNGPVTQIFTFEKSRVVMALSGSRQKIEFYKIDKMDCSTNCTSCSSLEPNYIHDGCTSCISGTPGYAVTSDVSELYDRCEPCNLGCYSCFGSKSNCYTHCNSLLPSNTLTDCWPVREPLGCDFHLSNSTGRCITCDVASRPLLFFYQGLCQECDPSCIGCRLPLIKECIKCAPGFFMANDFKCHKCAVGGTKCTGPGISQNYECLPGYGLKYGTCHKCFEYCETCSGVSSDECLTCKYPATDIRVKGTCHKTTSCTRGCLGCDHSSNKDCTLCKPGYIQNNNKCFNTCTIANCLSCSSFAVCTLCEPGYFIDKDLSTCLQCHSSCVECNGVLEDQCLTCSPGLAVFSGLCWDQVTCDASCTTCRGPRINDCLTCPGGSLLLGGECTGGCHPTCLTCFGPGEDRCLTCPGNGAIYFGKCINCAPNCSKCSSPSPTDCKMCDSGYLLVESRCIPGMPTCHPYCAVCYGTSNSECLDCKEGYSFFENTCNLCHPSCNGVCYGPLITDCAVNQGKSFSICEVNTGFDKQNAWDCMKCNNDDPRNTLYGSTCYRPNTFWFPKCKRDCLECFGGGENKCDKCAAKKWKTTSRVYNWGGECELIADNCLEPMEGQCGGCKPGYKMVYDNFNNYQFLCYQDLPVPCDPTCNTCEVGGNPKTCLSCPPGHSLNKGVCSRCHPNCLTCTGTSEKECLSCAPGNIMFEAYCFPGCDPACAVDSCIGPTSFDCITCSPGYTQTGSSCTNTCHSSCATCYSPLIDGCQSCHPGDTFVAGKCYTCPPECDVCVIENGQASCFNCPPGRQYLLVNGQNKCIVCHADCIGCLVENDNTSCQACSDPTAHQYKTECLQCHSTCPRGCSKSNDPNACYSCIPPLQQIYHLDSETGIETNRCIQCHYTCKTCFDTDRRNCASCYAGFQLNPDKSCQKCHTNCLHCSGSEISECITCRKGSVLIAGQCRKCHSSCLSCTNTGEQDCIRCSKGHTRVNNECVECDPSCMNCFNTGKKHCSECFVGGHYHDEECHYCHESCLTCKGNTFTDCLTCVPEKTHLPAVFMCVETCISGYYYDMGTSSCKPCAKNCKECTGGKMSDCTECASGYENINDFCTIICGDYKVRNAAINECTYCHPTCYTCSTSLIGDCIVCIDGREKYGGLCRLACQTDEFRDVADNGNCKKCHSLCKTCTASGVKNCQSCYQTATLIQSENYCRPICQESQWPDLDFCKECQPTCKTCSGGLVTDCTACFENEDLSNGECLCDTSKSLYKSPDSGKCLKCDRRCSSCSDSGLQGCSSCSQGFYLNQPGSGASLASHMPCLIDCPPTSFTNEDLRACILCHTSCLTCSGVSEQECLSCPPKKILFENKCLSFCPSGYYKDLETGLCGSCGDSCNICLGSKHCLGCQPPYFLQDSHCSLECVKGQGGWTDSEGLKLCQKCSPGCISCPDAKCSGCQEPLLSMNNTCVVECPEGFDEKVYSLPGNSKKHRQCLKIGCPKNCLDCDSVSGYCNRCKAEDSVTKIPFVLFDGKCLSCTKHSGLQWKGGRCSEICGDGILLALSLDGSEDKFKHQCDDKNTKEGDGCSSDCQVEKLRVCSRQGTPVDLSNYKNKDICIKEVKVTMERNMNVFDGVSILLRFSRKIQSFEGFERNYELYFQKDEDSTSKMLEFTALKGSSKILKIDLLASKIKQNYNGYLYIQKKSLETKKNNFFFRDYENYICDPNQTTMKFIFDYEAYLKTKTVTDNIEQLNSLMSNPIVKALMFLVMLNPICFDFIVNVLQKFLFFRALDIDPPINLQLFYKMFSDNVSVDLFATDYDQFVEQEEDENQEEDEEPVPEEDPMSPSIRDTDDAISMGSKVTKMVKDFIEEDQVPPFRFQALKMSALAIKTVLPSLVIVSIAYLVGVGLRGIKLKNSTKYLVKSDNIFIYLWNRPSLWTDISDVFIESIVWNYVTKTIFLLFQTISLGIFLNLSNLSFKTPKRTVSSLFTLISLPIIILVIVTFYKLMKKFKKQEGIVDKSLSILQDVKHKNIFCLNFKLYKYILKPILCSFAVSFLQRYTKLAALIIGCSYFVEMGWVMCFRPYTSIVLNIKSFISSACLLAISIIYFTLTIIQSESTKMIFGWIIIGLVFVLFLNLLFVKLFKNGSL